MTTSVFDRDRSTAGVGAGLAAAGNARGAGMRAADSNAELGAAQTFAQSSTRSGPATSPRRLVLLLPVVLFLGVALALGWGLTQDPRVIPSALIGKPVPEFNLPPVQGRTLGLSSAHLRGEVSLVNVFASWCTACRYEHPVFMRLKDEGVVPIHGINYKDRPQDAAKWLDDLGDPYTRTGADLDGRVSIEWGVYGVPETFVIDRDGRIVFKQIGPVTPEVYRDTIGPLLEDLRK